MADDTETYDPATDELMTQVEEPSSDEVTPEDYLAKMKLALLANEAMRREEAALDERSGWSPSAVPGPGTWQPPSGVALGGPPVAPPTLAPGATPALVNRGGQPFAGTPVPPPAGQGRIYMGPTMTPEQESSFMLSPPGTRTNLMPPPQITGPEAYDRGVESGLIQKPSARMTPNDIAWTPAYEQWAAQQDVQTEVANGVPVEQALMKHPAALIGTARAQDRERVVGPGQTLYRNGLPVGSVPPTPRPTVIKPTQAVTNLHKALIAAEVMAREKGEPRAQRVAQQNRMDFEAQHPELGLSVAPTATATPPPAAAPQGKPIKDKNGKTWLYTGTAADPKTDKDKSHWIAQ